MMLSKDISRFKDKTNAETISRFNIMFKRWQNFGYGYGYALSFAILSKRIRKDHFLFFKRKINYCITRKELLAVIKSIQHFIFTENF